MWNAPRPSESDIVVEKPESAAEAVERAKDTAQKPLGKSQPSGKSSRGEIVQFGRSVHVKANEVVNGDVVLFGGSADIDGVVTSLLILPVFFMLFVLCVTWVLIPFVVAGLIGLHLIGKVAVEVFIGKRVSAQCGWRAPSLVAIALIGLAVLALVNLMTGVPGEGLLAWLLNLGVCVFGIGAALMMGFGTDPTGT